MNSTLKNCEVAGTRTYTYTPTRTPSHANTHTRTHTCTRSTHIQRGAPDPTLIDDGEYKPDPSILKVWGAITHTHTHTHTYTHTPTHTHTLS